MTGPRLETRDLSIGYHARPPARPIASGLNLQLYDGELACLVGPNGAGKTTLLRTLAGLLHPLQGEIRIDANSIARLATEEMARRVGIVLTDQPHPGNLSVRQIVGLGRLPYTDWLGTLTRQDEAVVTAALARAGAAHLEQRAFGELSDGERQKTMIARALAQEPAVVILDEPTAYLDWMSRVETLVMLRDLARTSHQAFLISSHDLELALQLADRLWVMDRGGAVTCGTPEDLALGGVLSRVFSSQRGTFDPYTHALQLGRSAREPIAVMGEGITAEWARRALVRSGCALTSEPATRVIVQASADQPRWRVHVAGNTVHSVDSLEEMLRVIDTILP